MPYRPDPDEGPSQADQRQFGEDAVRTGLCPDCGAEVIDDADICPRCFAFLDGATLKRPDRRPKGFFHEQWKLLVLILLLLSMFGFGAIYAISRLGR